TDGVHEVSVSYQGNHVNGSPFTVYARSADPLSQLNDLRLLDEGLGSANIDKLRQLRSKLALLSWGRDDTSDFGYGESSCSMTVSGCPPRIRRQQCLTEPSLSSTTSNSKSSGSTSTGRKQQQQKQWKQFGPTGVANDRMLSQSRNKTLSAQAGTNSSQPQQQRRTMGLE
uniref:Cadherin_4 domain-containing protein n=1 Tax=Macrostomum lignano TaxID=282301 RepID=A0A1I8GI03_9PLAT